jgi:uncharacterized protein YcbK (DUF882 family)
MLLNLKADLERVSRDLTVAMGKTLPTKEFGADIVMAMVGLHVIESRIRKTQNLEERRRLTNEFKRKKRIIEKGIASLRRSSRGFSGNNENRVRRVLP